MENSIRISVIIPSYNRSKTIGRCIDSVLRQTYLPYEIIIVDDSSEDDTVGKVEEYKNPLIKCIVLKKNSGAQVARNRGIIEAKGDWIAFLDSDDEWIESKLEKQYEILKEYKFDPFVVIYSDCFWVNKNSKILNMKVPKISFDNSYRDLLKAPGPMFQGMLVSKIALEKISLLDVKVPSFQEWDTSLMLSKYCRFVYINEKLFKYHLHRGETISKDKKKGIQGYGYIINKFEEDMKKYRQWEGHISRQIYRGLELKQWKEVDYYLRKSPLNKQKLGFLFCRFFHIQPSNARKLLGNRYSR